MQVKPNDGTPRYCNGCGAKLWRKTGPSGKPEPRKNFLVRQHCDSRCYGIAMMRENASPSVPAQRKRLQKVIRADLCADCGSRYRLCRHHIDRDITNNAPSNIKILCPSCHAKRHWAEGEFQHVDWKTVQQQRRRNERGQFA